MKLSNLDKVNDLVQRAGQLRTLLKHDAQIMINVNGIHVDQATANGCREVLDTLHDAELKTVLAKLRKFGVEF